MTRLFWCLALVCALSSPASAEEVLQRESANGSRNLRPFTVKDGWELRWDAKGATFSVSLYKLNGDPVDQLASQQKPGPGASFYPKGGTYYLSIIAGGDWTVSVVQLP
ncbi:MAG: hypothetical protein JSR20_07060 [Nitrospira sp.]|nr:hypothetical protein [Nitrospira sp.]